MVAISSQQEKYTKGSGLNGYREMVVGDAPTGYFLLFELLTLILSSLPGLLGFGLRSVFYPFLFNDCGDRPAFGRNVLLRGAKQISLGNKVLIDSGAVLDCRGSDASVKLSDFVSIGRNSAVVAKDAQVELSEGVNIGSNVRIASQSSIKIGASTLIGAYCYIGPGNHQTAEGKAIIEQEMENKGGVEIGRNVWIGARVTILDGVKIGDNAIIGAHSLVKEDVMAKSTVVGTPARVVGTPTRDINSKSIKQRFTR